MNERKICLNVNEIRLSRVFTKHFAFKIVFREKVKITGINQKLFSWRKSLVDLRRLLKDVKQKKLKIDFSSGFSFYF